MSDNGGLYVRLDEFKRLPPREQMAVLFENQQKTMKMISGYRFNQKVTNWMLGILTTGMATLFGLIFMKGGNL